MPTVNDDLERYDDDDIELLEVRDKRRTRGNCLESKNYNPPAASQTQATHSRKGLCWEASHRFQSKTSSKNHTNEVDAMVELTEEGYVKLPFLHQLPSEDEHTPEPEGNIDRPYYNKGTHCEGVVAWWDNRTGKGMIIDHRYSLEHKIELKDIKYSNYGALVPGSMVEYEYSDYGTSKGFSKFWVVSGCEHVLWRDAWADDTKYLYMQQVKQEYYDREVRRR